MILLYIIWLILLIIAQQLARFKIKEFITYSLGLDNVKLTACLVYYFFKTSRTLYQYEVNLFHNITITSILFHEGKFYFS